MKLFSDIYLNLISRGMFAAGFMAVFAANVNSSIYYGSMVVLGLLLAAFVARVILIKTKKVVSTQQSSLRGLVDDILALPYFTLCCGVLCQLKGAEAAYLYIASATTAVLAIIGYFAARKKT